LKFSLPLTDMLKSHTRLAFLWVSYR